MTELFESGFRLIRRVQDQFFRFLFHQIDWEAQLIELLGSRGVGKTTMMLQKAKQLNRKFPQSALYLSLDDAAFYQYSLIEVAEEFIRNGGRYLFVDEVHRYPAKFLGYDWSAEIKNLYDKYPELRIVYSGSSILKLYKGQGDLSRRKTSFELPGLSFREYMILEKLHDFPALTLDQIMHEQADLQTILPNGFAVIKHFRDYLKFGYYPFYRESRSNYTNRLKEVITVVLENDIPAVMDISFETTFKLKKLLAVIASSAPFTPNLTKIQSELYIADQRTLIRYLNYLGQAGLISLLSQDAVGNQILHKPEKVFPANTNIQYCFDFLPINPGTQRETFFINQVSVMHKVSFSKHADFLINDQWTFEVGGKNKNPTQINKIPLSFLALDDLTSGFGRKIPLWMFGLLY